MLERGYVGHVGPDGRAVGERVAILDRRFVGGSGENIAEHEGIGIDQLAAQIGPLARKLVDGWMASPGHRKNLLEPAYTHFGLAAAGEGERWWSSRCSGSPRAARRADAARGRAGRRARLRRDGGQAPQQFAFAPPDTPVEDLVTLELSVQRGRRSSPASTG